MDEGDRSRREHAIEGNATKRVVYGQSNCRVRTPSNVIRVDGSPKGTHSVPYKSEKRA